MWNNIVKSKKLAKNNQSYGNLNHTISTHHIPNWNVPTAHPSSLQQKCFANPFSDGKISIFWFVQKEHTNDWTQYEERNCTLRKRERSKKQNRVMCWQKLLSSTWKWWSDSLLGYIHKNRARSVACRVASSPRYSTLVFRVFCVHIQENHKKVLANWNQTAKCIY